MHLHEKKENNELLMRVGHTFLAQAAHNDTMQ